MRRKLMLCITLLLAITLSGWTQSAAKWIVYKNGVDTVLVYPFSKLQIRTLRVYVTELEGYKDLYSIDQLIITKKDSIIKTYTKLVDNKDAIILNKDAVITQTNFINNKLTKDVIKFRKKSKRLPYYIGAGFIGGIVLCQLTK